MPTKAHDSKAGSKETETKPNIPKTPKPHDVISNYTNRNIYYVIKLTCTTLNAAKLAVKLSGH